MLENFYLEMIMNKYTDNKDLEKDIINEFSKADMEDKVRKFLMDIKNVFLSDNAFLASEFEDYAHKLIENNLPISKDILTEEYARLNKKYHGASVKHCKEITYEWLRIPHFYRALHGWLRSS